jgi:hypothetical protein
LHQVSQRADGAGLPPENGCLGVKFNLTKRKKNSLDGYFWRY